MAAPTVAEICVADVLAKARRDLSKAPFEPSPREAVLLLAYVTSTSEPWILAHGEAILDPHQRRRFSELLSRRLAGEPMAYLLGRREFYGRELQVDRRVLIPRPETEHLIEAVLALPLPPAPRILDIGTGSGAIAVTLAAEIPTSHLLATDVSLDALLVARENAKRLGVAGRINFFAADLTAPLDVSTIDLVVSNPPYLDVAERPELSIEVVDFEPATALFSPERGTSTLTRLIDAARALRPGTHLILEIGVGQIPALSAAVAQSAMTWVRAIQDYAGIERVVILRRTGDGHG
jgi:release factor glutamine methyltransferase